MHGSEVKQKYTIAVLTEKAIMNALHDHYLLVSIAYMEGKPVSAIVRDLYEQLAAIRRDKTLLKKLLEKEVKE